MARLRYNLVETTLAADIDDSETTVTFGSALQEGGVDIPTVSGPDILAIRIGSEIMHVTAYTSGGVSATVDREMEDSSADEHFAGDPVKHVITKEDVLDAATYYVPNTLSGWWQDNVTATQTNVVLAMANARTEVPMPTGGSVIGIAVRSNAARSAGTLTVEATIDGTAIGLTAVLDGTNTQTNVASQDVGTDVFTAGQRIGVKITTSGTWAPTTADIDVSVLVAYDAIVE